MREVNLGPLVHGSLFWTHLGRVFFNPPSIESDQKSSDKFPLHSVTEKATLYFGGFKGKPEACWAGFLNKRHVHRLFSKSLELQVWIFLGPGHDSDGNVYTESTTQQHVTSSHGLGSEQDKRQLTTKAKCHSSPQTCINMSVRIIYKYVYIYICM